MDSIQNEEKNLPEILGNILAQSGLHAMLGYLLAIFHEDGIVRVECNYENTSMDTTYVLASVDASETEILFLSHMAREKIESFPNMSANYNVYEPYAVNNFEFKPASMNSAFQEFSKFHSFLLLPIFPDKMNIFLFLFFSVKEKAFSEEKVEYLRSIMSPLLPRLTDYVRVNNIFSFTQIQEKQSQSRVFLQACSGLKDALLQAETLAQCPMNVLLYGETGVGKELFADVLHAASPFREGPLVKVNCGALPETLVDSLFFGHEKGAFTGANAQTKGYFELANKGTLFLDEIGEMDIDLQSRLLRVLDNQIVQRLGGNQSIQLHFRIIAATNRNLAEMVAKGQFRQDLFFRLAQCVIPIPPLRERKEDIWILASFFLQKYTRDDPSTDTLIIPQKEKQKLLDHPWPGNVRELEAVISRAVMERKMAPYRKSLHFSFLEIPSLSQISAQSIWPVHPATPAAGAGLPGLGGLGGMPASLSAEGAVSHQAAIHTAKGLPGADSSHIFDEAVGLEDLKDRYIEHILKKCNYVVTGEHGAARILGMHPQTLYRFIKKQKQETFMR